MVLVLFLIAGLAGLGGGGTLLITELTRPPTKAEIAAAGQKEIASRWQRLLAGQIFPASVSYVTSDGLHTTASRVGIARAISCPAGLDPQLAAVFRRYGCRAVLRATYTDTSGALAVTVGVAVLRGPAAARAAVGSAPPGTGVRAAAFPGTRAGLFGNKQRGWFQTTSAQGPYAFLSAAGYTDGRPGASRPDAGPTDLANGVLSRVDSILTGGKPSCQRKDIRC